MNTQAYSNITLALLDDSGWYAPDYGLGMFLRFGRLKGCDFAYKSCSSSGKSGSCSVPVLRSFPVIRGAEPRVWTLVLYAKMSSQNSVEIRLELGGRPYQWTYSLQNSQVVESSSRLLKLQYLVPPRPSLQRYLTANLSYHTSHFQHFWKS